MKNLIIGDGFLAKGLAAKLEIERESFLTTSRTPLKKNYLDLLRPEKFVFPNGIKTVFFCAGIAEKFKCEEETAYTRKVNVEGTLRILKRCYEKKIKFIFISSAEVFDGLRGGRNNFEMRNPKTEYGRQKKTVEDFMINNDGTGVIVRMTKIWSSDSLIIKKWKRSILSNTEIKAFNDVTISPISLKFAVTMLFQINKYLQKGVIHVSGEDSFTYFELAQRLAKILGRPENLVKPESGAGRVSRYASLDMSENSPKELRKPQPIGELFDEIVTC